MAVVQTLDRIRSGIRAVLEERSAPDDQVEFDASLGVMSAHGDGESECVVQTVVYIWVSLRCPEIAQEAKSTCQIVVPIYLVEDEDEVAKVGNDLWDALQSHRTLALLEAETEG